MRDRAELTAMLADTLGTERASEAVDTAADALSLAGRFQDADALRVLAHIAEEPGLVGIAARFAKSRAHLRWDIPRGPTDSHPGGVKTVKGDPT